MKNFIKLGGFSFFHYNYMYIDASKYLADSLLAKNKLSIKFKGDYISPDGKYIVVFCKVKKDDEEKFIQTMEELERNMLLCGYTDYTSYYKDLFKKMEEEHMKMSKAKNKVAI